MLNTYPLWKNLLVVVVVFLGGLYALPNLYPPDYAVQMSTQDSAVTVSQQNLGLATKALDAKNVEYFGAALEDGKGLIRFSSNEDQLRALQAISRALGHNFTVALNSAATTPEWLKSLGAAPMKYGLDLRGGVHFLLEVDTKKFMANRIEGMVQDIKDKLRAEKIRKATVSVLTANSIRAMFATEESRDQAEDLLARQYRELVITTGDDQGFYVDFTFTPDAIKEIENFAVGQNVQTIRNRVNELGVSEPLVQRLGRSRIVVDLPGVQDTTKAKEILNKIATLEFYWEANGKTPRSRSVEYDYEGRSVRLDKRVILSGDRVVNAQVGYDPDSGMPQTNITLDSEGGGVMHRATRNNVGRRMAVLFIETKTKTVHETVDEIEMEKSVRYKERRLISLATVQSALGVQFRITGLKAGEARDLALLLRAGALAADMFFVEERTVGASLGEENIELGAMSVSVGLVLVLIFMLAYYKVFGIAANLALMANLLLLVAVMSSLSATLTLPGIAGIVLTVGMAVDANVLIFSRIREELAAGMSPQAAINTGFERAFVTIVDANITTLLVAVVLLSIGTGPVKGFAVTLSIGILTSMFTAILGTRAIVNVIYGGRNIKRLMI